MKYIVALCLVVNTLLLAEAENASPADVESSKTEVVASLNYSNIQGNTNKTTLIGDLDAKKGFGKNVFSLDAFFQFSIDNNKEDKNLWWINPQYNYDLTDKISLSYQAMWLSNRYNGFWYQAYTGPGIEYFPVNTKTWLLSFRLSAFYEEDNVILDSGKFNTEKYGGASIRRFMSLSPGGTFNYNITDTIKFSEKFDYRLDPGYASNYFITNKAQIIVGLNSWLAFNIMNVVLYNNLPPSGKKRSDITTTAGLTLSY